MAELTPIDWAVRPLKRYAHFNGRAPRAEYWWFYLGTVIVGFLAEILDGSLMSEEVGWLSLVVNLGLIVPSIAVAVRRLHDTDRSGWWLLAPVLPAAVFGYQAIQAALSGSIDTWDPGVLAMIAIAALLIACIVLLIFMVLPGTTGPNSHGSDPYRPDEQLEEIFA